MMKPVERARTRLQGRARAAFSERLALKATALALALVLWFSVSVREPAEQVVSVRFMPSLEPGIVLAGEPAPIRALVRGSGRDILKLYSSPPAIRMSIGGEVGDSMTLALRPGDVDIPPGVSAVVREVQPRRVTLTFRRVGQRARRDTASNGAGWARPVPDTPPVVDTVIRTVPAVVAPSSSDSGAVDSDASLDTATAP